MNSPTASPTTGLEHGLSEAPVMAVLRGLSPAETVRLAELAWSIGATQVEVPIETLDAVPSLRAAVAAGRERGAPIGAGTITTRDQLETALDVGAAYGVSPGFDTEVIERARNAGLPFLPGVSTPSEILRARRHGFTWVKAFPAAVLGTAWFAAMRGPFPSVRFVATGGIDGVNAAGFLEAGASVVGVSRALDHPGQREALAEIISRHAAG